MRSLFLLAALACVMGSILAGCGGASCDSPRCSADPKPNDSTISGCKTIQATKCSDEFNDWAGCVDSATTCDMATKTTDPATRVAAFKTCVPKYTVMQDCCATYQVTCPSTR